MGVYSVIYINGRVLYLKDKHWTTNKDEIAIARYAKLSILTPDQYIDSPLQWGGMCVVGVGGVRRDGPRAFHALHYGPSTS